MSIILIQMHTWTDILSSHDNSEEVGEVEDDFTLSSSEAGTPEG